VKPPPAAKPAAPNGSDLPKTLTDNPDFDRPFPKPPARRRWLLGVLAISTAVVVLLLLLKPPGGAKHWPPPPPADVARCAPGQTSGCVGGKAEVIVAPASR
jgi:hypothetical protein